MSKIYMYPKNDYKTLFSPNPYVLNLEAALSERHIIINKEPNNRGVIDLFFYLLKTDIFFFNWIENVSLKRKGKLQFSLFLLFLFLAKISNKRIIWVLHNKYSHESRNQKWTILGFRIMIKYADLIITHSEAGIEFIRDNFPKYIFKVKYLIHPVEDMLAYNNQQDLKYDLLIWGTIHPYKGVIEFLKYTKESPLFQNIKILVSGICADKNEEKILKEIVSENLQHINKFQPIEEIAKLAGKSRYILFTYNSDSVLSSGSLMDSIRMGASIIGPNKGAFKDLKCFNFINIFNTFDDIASIIENKKHFGNKSKENETFCRQNSWMSFGTKLFSVSDGIL